jgi:hypothetical protein
MRATRLLAIVLAVAAAALALPACFNPKLEPGFGCGEPDPGPQCPDGFFCDQVTYTCQLDGTEPTPAGVDLGLMLRGPVAARLGDDVVVAGYVVEPPSQVPVFQVRSFDKKGKPVGTATDLTAQFADVDHKSLRAAGSDNAAVIVGRTTGDGTLAIAWVTGAGVVPETTSVVYDAFTVTSSLQLACLAAGYTPDVGFSTIDVKCYNGMPAPSPQRPADHRLGFRSLAAGVGDDNNAVVVVAEVPNQIASSTSDLFAFCPGQPAPPTPFAPNHIPPEDTLAPQVFFSPQDGVAHVAWMTKLGLRTTQLDATDWTNCTVTRPGSLVGTSQVTAFSMVGRGKATGYGQGAGSWTIDLHPNAADPSIANLVTLVDTTFTVDHAIMANPQALTTKDNAPWFFLFAADDSAPSQGYFKYTNLSSMGQDLRYLETLVTSDFAVARRNAGTFFVVYREDQDGTGEDQPLPASLALLDPAGDLEAPSE